MQFLLDFVNDILDFVHSGIFDFISKAFAQFVIYATISMIKFKIIAVTFAWSVAQEIINQLNISSYLQAAWDSFDSKTLSLVTYLRIPEAINILLSARVTRFVLDFMGV